MGAKTEIFYCCIPLILIVGGWKVVLWLCNLSEVVKDEFT